MRKKILVVKEKKSVFFYKDYMNNIRDFVHPTLSFSSGELVFLRVHGSRYVLSGWRWLKNTIYHCTKLDDTHSWYGENGWNRCQMDICSCKSNTRNNTYAYTNMYLQAAQKTEKVVKYSQTIGFNRSPVYPLSKKSQ